MIVTRAVSEGSLNEDVSHQFTAQPHAIMISGLAVLVMAVIPGMPKIPMFIIAGALVGGGYYISTKIKSEPMMASAAVYGMENGAEAGAVAQAAAAQAPVTEEDYFKDVNNVYSLLTLEPIEMEFGYSLIPMADESSGGRLISRIVISAGSMHRIWDMWFPPSVSATAPCWRPASIALRSAGKKWQEERS